jgi:membrane protease subunit (stomatin/prohibitin family)
MTKRANFDGLTNAQAALFERIAVGDDTRVNDHTAQVLIDKGLIEQYDQRDGMFTWHRYRVPVAVHIRWCEWCDGKGK